MSEIHTALISSKALNMFPERLTDAYEWQGHIPFAFWLVETAKPSVFVELGTYKGDSYAAFCQAIKGFGVGCQAHAIDAWEGDRHIGKYGDEIYNDFRQYHDSKYGAFSRLHRMRFEAAVESFSSASVDLLHIDGLHTYDAVRSDFETWQSKLSDRAVVLFHDSSVREREFGVWQYLKELEKEYPIFYFNHSNGLACLIYGSEASKLLKDMAALSEKEADSIRAYFHALGDRVQACSQVEFWRKESQKLFCQMEWLRNQAGGE